MQKSEAASKETNRAVAAAWNAEVRRAKGRLMDEVPKLTKLANKKVCEKYDIHVFQRSRGVFTILILSVTG